MRASFQGQNILVLGNGFAKLHVLRLIADERKAQKPSSDSKSSPTKKTPP
jgi:hypothetical protein